MHTLRIGWQVSVPIARAALYDLVELPSTASSNLSETVTPASNPMVNFEHLTAPVAKDGQTPPRHLAFASAIDTLRSKVQPRAFTKSDGSFEFSGLPTGWIANAYGYHRERLLDGIVAIGTSDDVSLKTSTMEALTLPVLRSPASLVLEPGVKVGGVIVDELGMPVSGTMVSSYASGYKVRTDALGKFQYDESALYFKAMTRLDERCSIFATPPEKSDYLSANFRLAANEILCGKSLRLSLRKGVKVTGKVITEDGQPIANVRVKASGDWWPQEIERRDLHASTTCVTNSHGQYEILLLPGAKCDLLFATDESGYALPSNLELDRGKANQFNSPHVEVDVTDGKPVELQPFVVSKLAPLEVSVLRIDGRPAIGAVVRLHEQNQRTEDTFRREAETFTTDNFGNATIEIKRNPFSNALIEATLIDGTHGYFGLTSYANAKSGKAKIQLKNGTLIQGRVLMQGQPVANAQVGIHLRVPTSTQQGNVSVRGYATNEYDFIRTGTDGIYRTVLPKDKEFEVNVQMAGGWAHELLTPVRPLRPNSEGVLTGDFDLKLGVEGISGVVVDESDKPLEHMHVEIEATSGIDPRSFIGYNQSQFTTNTNGKFSLTNVPAGTYTITVPRPPRLNPSNPAQLIHQEPVRATARSGDRNLCIKIRR